MDWLHNQHNGKDGVVTGCNANYEWILPWWYENFANFNGCGVLFADFGMSEQARDWCSEKGLLVDITQKLRKDWFKKPMALLHSPFRRTVWVDIDCQVLGDISQIFDYSENGFAVTLDPHSPWCKNVDAVASGVVGALHGNQLVVEWAWECSNSSLRGDQEVLNTLITKRRKLLTIMPPEFQWLRIDGFNKKAIIMHWTGTKGKNEIRRQMGLSELKPNRRVRGSRMNRVSLLNARSGAIKKITPVKAQQKVVKRISVLNMKLRSKG